MKEYRNLPEKGKARKMWLALCPEIIELHYNANCFGKAKDKGWGTWACTFSNGNMFWCGLDKKGIYLEQMSAPYNRNYIGGSPKLSTEKGCGKLIEEIEGVKISCGDFNGKVLCEKCSLTTIKEKLK